MAVHEGRLPGSDATHWKCWPPYLGISLNASYPGAMMSGVPNESYNWTLENTLYGESAVWVTAAVAEPPVELTRTRNLRIYPGTATRGWLICPPSAFPVLWYCTRMPAWA